MMLAARILEDAKVITHKNRYIDSMNETILALVSSTMTSNWAAGQTKQNTIDVNWPTNNDVGYSATYIKNG